MILKAVSGLPTLLKGDDDRDEVGDDDGEGGGDGGGEDDRPGSSKVVYWGTGAFFKTR